MSVFIQENEKWFRLQTEHTEYQMRVDALGVLRHLWYGAVTNTRMDYLLSYGDVGFSGNPNDAGNERSYSLDTLPQEYACEGTGDYRITALSVRQGSVRAADLRYAGYVLRKGKYSIPGLPAAYAAESEAETLEIVLKDERLGFMVELKYGIFAAEDVITRSVAFRNEGHEPLILENAASLCLDIPWGSWEWIHFRGRHTQERLPQRRPLFQGIQESASTRGASSHQQNPAVLLCEPSCTETAGACVGALLCYSGSFQTKIELDQLGQVRLIMGIHPDLFQWTLPPGGEFHTPEALLCYSGEGFQTLSHRYHRFIREHICRAGQFERRPVLINNWEATHFDFDEARICAIAEQAAALGVEMLVLDDGWFGKRNDDCSGLGDWTENREKLPDGLSGLAEKLNAMGMKLGLWFEPEAISEDSDLYRQHPDWALQIPGRPPIRARFQLMLDLSRRDVEDYLFDSISKILRQTDIIYVKWDMNRSFSDWYSVQLPPERMGELPHRYVLGLYSLLERLTTAFPHVLFEGCSGGGGRFDAGMLYYCPQIWCSDNTDAYERTKIQYGTSFFYPISTVGSHVSATPNQQTGRETPLEARATVAMAGSFGYELDLGLLSVQDREEIREQIAQYKENQALIYSGTYYRLSDPLRDPWAAWEFVSPDQSQALVQGLVFHTQPNALRPVWKPRGLAPDRRYRINGIDGESWTGAALMAGGILLPATWGDFCPATFQIQAIPAET